jgi:DNA-binding NarL/FixJ family response regulator
MTRVLIATADLALCSALKLVLCQRLPTTVVGELANRHDLDAALRQLQPDLLLVDWALPEFRDAGSLATYQALATQMYMVVLSVAVEEIAGVLAGGAHACLAQGASPDNLLGLLRPFVYGPETKKTPAGGECCHPPPTGDSRPWA